MLLSHNLSPIAGAAGGGERWRKVPPVQVPSCHPGIQVSGVALVIAIKQPPSPPYHDENSRPPPHFPLCLCLGNRCKMFC